MTLMHVSMHVPAGHGHKINSLQTDTCSYIPKLLVDCTCPSKTIIL